MSKISLDAVMVCEGKYDKIKLSSIFDTTIITTNGFSIYNDDEKILLLKKLGKIKPILILTDSDVAGFKIRTFLKNILDGAEIHHIYIPDIFGKEKRKHSPSKEGKLGVEGVETKLLIELVQKVLVKSTESKKDISKNHLYFAGLLGGENSRQKRSVFLEQIGLPQHISTNALVDLLNILFTEEEFNEIIENLKI